jgi:hypothetical protein
VRDTTGETEKTLTLETAHAQTTKANSPRLPDEVDLRTPPISPQPLRVNPALPVYSSSLEPQSERANESMLSAPFNFDSLLSNGDLGDIANSTFSFFEETGKQDNLITVASFLTK